MSYPFDFISEMNFVNDEITKSDVLIVPGGSHRQIIEKAVELFNQGMADYILTVGGENERLPNQQTEAEFQQLIAIEKGVPPEKVLSESSGYSIYENAIFSFEKLKNEDVKYDKVIIVCKAFQSRRVLLAYQKIFPVNTQFLTCSVTDNRGITKENWYTNADYISVVMHEVSKIGRYFNSSILPMYERTL